MKKSLLFLVLLMSAVIINAQTKTAVKTADLPKTVTESITKEYAGYTVKDAVKVVTNNVPTYEVVIVKGTASETLLYDKDWKFVKKLTVKTATPEKKEPTPPAKQNPPVKK
jgi:hypothetical protein